MRTDGRITNSHDLFDIFIMLMRRVQDSECAFRVDPSNDAFEIVDERRGGFTLRMKVKRGTCDAAKRLLETVFRELERGHAPSSYDVTALYDLFDPSCR